MHRVSDDLAGVGAMRRSRINWSDLEFVLAVANQGSLAAAAKALGVNHSTVLRRVQVFEEAQAVRLFDRLPTGYSLTPAGEIILSAARSIADMVGELEGRISGQDLRLAGMLRITTTDTIMASILPPVLAAFRKQNPAVKLEVSIGSEIANLAKREADLAIRVATAPPEALIGRRISRVAMAIYSASSDAAEQAPLSALLLENWAGLSDGFDDTPVGRWIRANVPEDRIVLRTDGLLSLGQASAAGVGLAPLPVYLGDSMPGLRRVSPIVHLKPEPGLWILSHADLKRTTRVRAFVEFAAAAFAAERDRLEG